MELPSESNRKKKSSHSVPPHLLPPPEDSVWGDKPSDQCRVYANVTFDAFHYGHVNFLHSAVRLARCKFPEKTPYVIIGLCTDEACQLGKRQPIFCWEERAAMVRSCRYVDRVFRAEYVTPKVDVEKMGIDLIVTGTDYTAEGVAKYFPGSEHLHGFVDYTPGVSTTDIVERFQRITVKKSIIAGTDPDRVKSQ